ncbi:MAG: recombination mediator RecR [bacterium]|nr:recombination mediator RecR [bacterium]
MLPKQIKRLIEELNKLPGIGPKSAERLTFYLLQKDHGRLQALAEAVAGLKQGLRFCQRCCNLSEQETCNICEHPGRERQTLCLVESPMDVFVLEETGVYKGIYHVLHGAISPLDGVGPEHLTIAQLLKRFEQETFAEIILATNPTVTGEATAAHVSRLLQPRGIRITHLAQGIPMGGQIEFADQDTLKRALNGRREF